MRHGSWLVAVVVGFAVACGGGGGGDNNPPAGGYTVGGSVIGLGSASGLVVTGAGQEVAVPAGATSYAFANRFQNGNYELTLRAPAGMSCAFANQGQIVVNGADVANADIECAALTFSLGGTVTGLPTPGSVVLQDGTGQQVSVSAEGPFVFPARLATGTQYAVSVVTPPSGRTCTVANGTGTVASANVTNVQVSCGAATFTVGGAVNGLAAEGLSITSNIPGAAPLSVPPSETRYQLAGRAPNGSYQLSIAASPAGVTCTFDGAGTTRTVVVNGADVTNANVTCSGAVVQRWAAPTTWGGSAQTFWPDDDPALVQHAYFTASGIQETKSVGWALAPGAQPTFEQLDAFPAGPRFGAGPFPQEGANFQATSPDARLDITGGMLVCAVFEPDTDPITNGWEKPIISKGFGNFTNYLPTSGWSLMQMNEGFNFHYELLDANGESRNAMATLPTQFVNGNVYGPGNLNPRVNPPGALRSPRPTWVVVCGGRDGEDLVVAANSVDTLKRTSLAPFGPAPHVLDAAVSEPATIGGFTGPLGIAGSNHVFGGRVYETAVWNEPATPENIREKLAIVQGLASGVTYTRNRPGPFQFSTIGGGEYYTTWNHGPRIDPTKGILIGLQSWNRVNSWMPADGTFIFNPSVFPASENLGLWSAAGGASVAADTAATPRGVGAPAQLVTLPAGASLSIPLDEARANPITSAVGNRQPTWRSRGLVHGEIWVRVPSAQPAGATLRVHKTDPNPDTLGSDHYDIDLGALTPGAWTRVWLNGAGGALSTSGSQAGVLSLQNVGAGPISFNAWGITLTQIGGGGDLNSMSAVPIPFSQPSPDPGPFMYDWSGSNDYTGSFATFFVEDVLQPPAISASTAATGFCLSVDARPADAFAWDVRMHDSRTAIAWANSPDPAQVTRVLRLYVDGLDGPNDGQICFASRALGTPGDWATVQPEQVIACGPVPAGWTAGSAHNLKACSTPAGALSIYGDYDTNPTPIATGTLANVPDLGTGRLLIGNGVNRPSSNSTPWHGYVSAAAACHATDIAACR